MTTGTLTLPRLRWRWLAIALVMAALVVADLLATAHLWLTWIQFGAPRNDWDIFAAIPVEQPYDYFAFRWTPLAGWMMATLVVPMGITVWRIAHLASLVFLRDWWIIAIVAVSFPFIYDVADANLLTFAFVAAWCALRGDRIGTGIFLAMTVLIPRPLMIPVAAYLLWHRPEWRLPFVGMVVGVLAHAVAVGQLVPFVERLLATPGPEIDAFFNIGPSRIIGGWWMLVGVPLAAWLTRRGLVGLASLAISPYWIAYYLLFGLLDLRSVVRRRVEVRGPVEA